ALAFVVLRFSDSDPFRTFWSAPIFQRMNVIGMAVVSILLIYIPAINKSFGFAAAGFGELMISIVLGLLPAVIYFFVKKFIAPKFSYENTK
ncbi:MAG: hypothetical protein K2J77_10445, partial [Oscillospiraceae bacterium]|nr:hypothetical protein [Oscillospiraceae bacterium]